MQLQNKIQNGAMPNRTPGCIFDTPILDARGASLTKFQPNWKICSWFTEI